ncbi:hypothetical protein B0I37DRAFT_25724 [Chaetomium sp. MPI-CAGE-AT-0009]|nr:hypothetical protein B0I37DRAFT_25724 [Chaetomium sp. MPI-CAGE-AT-0009]
MAHRVSTIPRQSAQGTQRPIKLDGSPQTCVKQTRGSPVVGKGFPRLSWCEMESLFMYGVCVHTKLRLVRGRHHSPTAPPHHCMRVNSLLKLVEACIMWYHPGARCSSTSRPVSQHLTSHASRAPLMRRPLAGFRPGTRFWMATKASQITKRFARSRPQHVISLAEGVRAHGAHGFLPHSQTSLTDLVAAAAVGRTDKQPETCRATATLIPYLPLIAIWRRLSQSATVGIVSVPCCGTRSKRRGLRQEATSSL